MPKTTSPRSLPSRLPFSRTSYRLHAQCVILINPLEQKSGKYRKKIIHRKKTSEEIRRAGAA